MVGAKWIVVDENIAHRNEPRGDCGEREEAARVRVRVRVRRSLRV